MRGHEPAKEKARRYPSPQDTYCVDYLSMWGTNAKPAVPLILDLLQSTDWDKRLAVTNSLPRIDLEAAKRAHLVRE